MDIENILSLRCLFLCAKASMMRQVHWTFSNSIMQRRRHVVLIAFCCHIMISLVGFSAIDMAMLFVKIPILHCTRTYAKMLLEGT